MSFWQVSAISGHMILSVSVNSAQINLNNLLTELELPIVWYNIRFRIIFAHFWGAKLWFLWSKNTFFCGANIYFLLIPNFEQIGLFKYLTCNLVLSNVFTYNIVMHLSYLWCSVLIIAQLRINNSKNW